MIGYLPTSIPEEPPFLDGNGRLGRILIALMAVKYGLVDAPIFLVSEEFERERSRYYDLLNAVRGNDPDWYSWLSFFMKARVRSYLLLGFHALM